MSNSLNVLERRRLWTSSIGRASGLEVMVDVYQRIGSPEVVSVVAAVTRNLDRVFPRLVKSRRCYQTRTLSFLILLCATNDLQIWS